MLSRFCAPVQPIPSVEDIHDNVGYSPFPSEMDAAEFCAWLDEHHVALTEAEELAMEAAWLANELCRELAIDAA